MTYAEARALSKATEDLKLLKAIVESLENRVHALEQERHVTKRRRRPVQEEMAT